jgi:hypothetical protein
MNGYLMQEREWVPGEDLFLESLSPENEFGVVLEYDGETLYFYAVDRDKEGPGIRILDALHIWENRDGPDAREEAPEDQPEDQPQDQPEDQPMKLQLVWAKDWLKCALVIDGLCHALFDFVAHGGYNVNEFPPPNGSWTLSDRKLTREIISRLF